MPALAVAARSAAARRATSSSIGGGYTGINARAVLARRGRAVTLLEAETLGFGGSTRNGGIVHPGYKWGPQELSSATARRPAGRSSARRSTPTSSSSG
jgi:glycine/D-amino acid oxidase-like deaminating enzyme